MASMLGLLRAWALQTVSELPFRFWLSETGEVVMSLEQQFHIIEKRLSIGREENCNRRNSSRSRGRSVMEGKLESEKGQAEGGIKDSLSENSEEDFKLSEVGLELVRKRCSKQDKAKRNFQNVVDLLQLSEEQAEHLSLIMLGEVNREVQVGIKYRYDQRTGQETIVIPSERLETNIVSTEFEKKSFKLFGEEVCRRKENVCNRDQKCKKYDEEK